MTKGSIFAQNVYSRMYKSEKQYPNKLPPDLQEWYAYILDCGHSIMCGIKSQWRADEMSIREDLLSPIPVKTVLKGYEITNDGYILVDVEYSQELGAITPEEDSEF